MSEITPRYATYAIGVLFLVNLANQLDRNILASLLPLIQSEYGVSDQWAGLLGSSFIWVFMIAAVPFGYWADRGSRTRIISGGLATWSLATAASGLVPSFAALFATRAMVGIGEAGYAAAAPSMIADYFPPKQRTRALSVFFVAMPVGAGMGFVLGGILGEAVGWRQAFLWAAAPGLLLALLTWGLREPVRGRHDVSRETDKLPMLEAVRRLLRIRSYLVVVVTGTLVTFAIGGVAVWLPTYLVRAYGISVAEAGTISGIGLMVGSLSGTLAGGLVADRLARTQRNALVHTIGGSLIVTALVLPLIFWFESRAALLPLLTLSSFFLFWHAGPLNSLIANICPPNVRGVAVSLQILIIHLLGDAFSPALIGFASDALQARGVGEADALRSVMIYLVPIPVLIAALCAEVAGFWAPADMQRVIGDPHAAPEPRGGEKQVVGC